MQYPDAYDAKGELQEQVGAVRPMMERRVRKAI
jgi:hypothetical protein